jgi:hypothetical protein
MGLCLAAALVLMPAPAFAWYYDWSYYEYAYPSDLYEVYDYYYADYMYYPATYYYYYPQQVSYYYYPQYSAYPTYSYGSAAPSPYSWSYPTGDTDTFGYDICNWEGYGRARCDFNPRQPVYDHWSGTWY